ncbi:uridine kinase family protein [Alkaliphilus pronyensis]|uniref:uridine kinase family protein n=1 Tax=Alkaliphilus pronyensis TaxID=1482732 RepID=UPI001A9AB7F9|nr:P-loop NTPase fold protein [Alkaliphilus pronyensis]
MEFKNDKGKAVSYSDLIFTVLNLPQKQKTLLIGIDGCGGAGKSSLAKKLSEEYNQITIVHMDDFYLPSQLRNNGDPEDKEIGADFDWRRLKKQVLEPLVNDNAATYQKYDWSSDNLGEWVEVKVGGIVLVEGVYSTRKELAKLYDFKIWIDAPRELRLERGIERDGEEYRELWEKWMIGEDMYVENHRPIDTADLVLNSKV